MIQETEEIFLLRKCFKKYNVKDVAIIGGDPRKHYEDLAKVLGFNTIWHIPAEDKLKRIHKQIHEAVKNVQLVIAVPFKRYEIDCFISETLKEYPKPLVHTMGSDGAAHIIKSLYIKREGLEKILPLGHGEI